MKKYRLLLGLSLFVIGLMLGLTWWQYNRFQVTPAPAAEFNLIDGRQLSLSAQQGQPVIITFWATTCSICMQEMPDWAQLYQDYNGQLELIAVAMPYDRADWILHIAKDWPFAVALDPMGELTQAFDQVEFTPTTFVISPTGLMVEKILGRVDFAKLRGSLQQWL